MEELISQVHFVNDFWISLLPAILMVLDIITGFVNAWSKNDIKSSAMRQGLARKFGELVILAIGQIFFYGIGVHKYLVSGLSAYIIIMELTSICENLKKLGVPIPKFIGKVLANAEEKIDSIGDDETDEKEDPSDEREKS